MKFNQCYDEIKSEKSNITKNLYQILKNTKFENKYKEIIFLCIGTDRIIGDCFGPLVGTKLEEKLAQTNIFNIQIYGTLNNNITYSNIYETLNKIYKENDKPYIIVIDAALSSKEDIGKIYINNGKTILGKGLNKTKIEVGNMSLKAVVGKDYKIPTYNFIILQNVSLKTVINLSDLVSESIKEVILKY